MSKKSKRVDDAIKTVRKNISIRRDILKKLEKESIESGYSHSYIIQVALLEYLENKKEQ